MKITNKPDQVIVEHEGLTFVFNFNTLYKDILKSDILKYISLQELRQLFLVGTPNNIKEFLQKKIEFYDSSSEVNSFIYKGKQYWLDKQQRSCMKTVAESGLENIEIVFGDITITLPSEFIKQFILQLEVYAYKCFVVTAKHYQNISELYNPEDIINYDYTKGYPEKITFNYE